MAETTEITNVLKITGIDSVATAFRQLGDAGSRAFNSLTSSAEKVGPAVDKAAVPVKKLTGNVQELEGASRRAAAANENLAASNENVAVSAQAASQRTGAFLSVLGKVAIGLGALATAATAAGTAAFLFAQKTAQGVNDLAKAATSAGQTAQSYQQLGFALQQIGLSQADASAQSAKFAQSIKDAATAGEAHLKALGVRFADTEDKAGRVASLLENLGKRRGNVITFERGQDVVGEKILEVLKKMGQELPKTAGGIKNLADVLVGLTATEREAALVAQDELFSAMEKLGIAFPATAEGSAALQAQLSKLAGSGKEFGAGASTSVKATQDLNRALLAAHKASVDFAGASDQGVRSLAAFADVLKQVKDPAVQAAIVQKQFATDAEKLLPILRQGGEAIRKYGDDFKTLGLGLTADNIERAKKFGDAVKGLSLELARLGAVSEKGKVNLGGIFQTLFTPLITAATKALRDYTNASAQAEGILVKLGEAFAAVLGPAVEGLIALLPRLSAMLSDPSFATSAREAVIAFGNTVKNIFSNVVVPAFEALRGAAVTAANAINDFFGTQLTGTDFAILAVITQLIGGFKTLGLALVALFTGTGPAMEQFSGKLRGIGIDLEAVRDIIVAFVSTTMRDLREAFAGRDSNVSQTWILAIRDVLQSMPAIIIGVIAAFLLLKRGVQGVATALSTAFKTPVSALQVGIVAALLQATGILPILTALLIGAAAASTLLFNALRTVGLLLAGMAAAVGWPIVLAAGIALLITNFENLKGVAQTVADVLNSVFGTEFITGAGVLVTAITLLSGALAFVVTKLVIFGTAIAAIPTVIGLAVIAVTLLALNLEKIGGLLEPFAKKLNEIFGTKFTGSGILEVFKQLGQLMLPVLAVVNLLERAFRALGIIGKKAGEGVGEGAKKSTGLVEDLKNEATALFEQMRTGSVGAYDKMVAAGRGVIDVNRRIADSFRELGAAGEAASQKANVRTVGGGEGPIAAQIRRSQEQTAALKKSKEEQSALNALIEEGQRRLELFKGTFDEVQKSVAATEGAIKDAFDSTIEPKVDTKPLEDVKTKIGEIKDEAGKVEFNLLKPGGDPAGGFRPIIDGLSNFKTKVEEIGGKIRDFFSNLFTVGKAGAAGGGGGDAEAQAAQIVLPFQIAEQRIRELFAAMQQTLKSGLTPPAIDLNALLEPFAAAEQRVREFIATIGELLGQGLKLPALDIAPLIESLNQAAAAIETFRTNSATPIPPPLVDWSSFVIAAQTAFTAVNELFVTFFSSLSLQSVTATTVFGQITIAAQTMGFSVQASLQQLISSISSLTQSVSQIGQTFIQAGNSASFAFQPLLSIMQQLQSAIFSLESAGTQMGSTIAQAAAQATQAMNALEQAALAAAKAAAAATSGGGGGGGFAAGGKLRGRGTPTSDSIPLWGSRDEWMIRAKAAGYYGDRLMAMINSARIPREALIAALRGGIPRFSMGGALSGVANSFTMPAMVMPSFAEGGPISGKAVTVDLKIGGQSLGTVQASQDTVANLQRLSTHAKLVATGASPNWRR